MSRFSPTGNMLAARGAYLRLLSEKRTLTEVSLAGLAPDDQPILLKDIYVPLQVYSERLEDGVSEEDLERLARPLGTWLSGERAGARTPGVLFLSGAAGSGKTTLARALVEGIVRGGGETLGEAFRDHVPFPIFLRDFALDEIGDLEGLVDRWLERVLAEAPADLRFDPEALKKYLERGAGLILLDGFDEVGGLEPRHRVLRWLERHPWTSPRDGRPANWTILAGRPSGFEAIKTERLNVVGSLHVAPFSFAQIHRYLERWFALRPVERETREVTVAELVARLTSGDEAKRLLPLARRPAYLAALAFVHGTRGKLPHTRAALYELLVDAYLEALDQHRKLRHQQPKPWDRQEKIEILADVAHQAHVGGTKGDSAFPFTLRDPRIQWSADELEGAVRSAIQRRSGRLRTIEVEDARDLGRYFVARTGLLAEAAEGVFQFAHLSLQEYLAALHLLDEASAEENKAEALAETLFPRIGQAGWTEVGLLLLSIDAARTGGRGHEAILARLDPSESAHMAFLAAALAEREIRFTEAERESWLRAWALAWVCQRGTDFDARDRALSAESARGVLAACRVGLLEGWLGGGDPLAELRGTIGTKGSQRFAGRVEPPKDRDRLLANVVSLLPPSEPPGADGEALPLLVAACARLEFSPCGPDEDPQLPEAWFSLYARGLLDLELGRAVARATPLIWWMIKTPLISFVRQPDGVSSDVLSTWRNQVTRRSFQIEGAFWRNVGGDLALSLDLAWYQTQAIDMEQYLEINRGLNFYNLPLDTGLKPAEDLALARIRALSWSRDMIHYWDHDLDLDLPPEPATRLAVVLGAKFSPHIENFGRLLAAPEVQDGPFHQSLLLAVAALHGGLAAVGLGGMRTVVFRREDLMAERDAWRRGEAPGEPPAAIAEQAKRECRELTDSYRSPLPWLDVTLGFLWDEIELSAEAVVKQFNDTINRLWKELKKGRYGT